MSLIWIYVEKAPPRLINIPHYKQMVMTKSFIRKLIKIILLINIVNSNIF